MIQVKHGDILKAFEEGCHIICHQVNCRGRMNAGLAKSIAECWPEVKRDYEELCLEQKAEDLLGTYLITPIDDHSVISIFGQLNYGRNSDVCYTSYEALKCAFQTMQRAFSWWEFYPKIAFPYGLGCGLGGGDWNVVYQMIVDFFHDYDIVIYKKENVL